MSLSILVSQDKWQDFDSAWTDLMNQEGEPVDDLIDALALVGEKKRMPRCLPLVKEHVGLLEAADRHADAARVLGAALRGGAAGGELSDALWRDAQTAWAAEVWWPRFIELSGLSSDAHDVRRAWLAFERLRAFRPGTLVYHPGGWGTGEVLELRQAEGEIVVRFQSGRQDVFPLSGAVDIFESLPEGDLRALHFRDAGGMKKRLKDEPLEMLRAVLDRYHGRATLIQIRNALMQVGVEGSGWTAWWRKARKLAMNSRWFKVTGTPQRGEVQLLLSEGDPAADLQRELDSSLDLGETLKQVRGTLGAKDLEPRLRQVALDTLEQGSADETARPVDRLAAWLLLYEETGEVSPGLADALRSLAALPVPADPAVPPPLWATLAALSTAKEQERAVAAMKVVLGEGWLDECLRQLQHAPPGAVRPIVDAAVAAKRKPELVAHYADLLSRPLRSPHVLVTLARYVERWKPTEGVPTGSQRAQSLLSLATYLFLNRRGNPPLVRVFNRLTELLARGDALLPKLLVDADRESLASVYRIAQRGVDEAIDNLVSDLGLRSIQELAGTEPAQFWQNDRIWTTRRGLERRRAELKDLVEVKIPANTEAIGRAASMGDLSENAEWEAAIEEQGNLSRRAASIEEELGRIDLIEDAALPDDTVSPGTAVHYRETASGKERRIEILGPWDTEGADQVVSYRAPLAEALLGLHPGGKAKVQLPSGELEVEVVAIETMNFG